MEPVMSWILFTSVFVLFAPINCRNSIQQYEQNKRNVSESKKDMYVINAMVYQVGIITNKTDDKYLNSTVGNQEQEALTLYRNNGSKFDLSQIPEPLLTNVTAQSIVQVAPKHIVTGDLSGKRLIALEDIKNVASLQQGVPEINLGKEKNSKIVRRNILLDDQNALETSENLRNSRNSPTQDNYYSLPLNLREFFKREVPDNNTTIKVVKGAAVIPQGAVVQPVAIPPLLALNNNLSNIPVPIPNTSVVHYAKINTLIRQP